MTVLMYRFFPKMPVGHVILFSCHNFGVTCSNFWVICHNYRVTCHNFSGHSYLLLWSVLRNLNFIHFLKNHQFYNFRITCHNIRGHVSSFRVTCHNFGVICHHFRVKWPGNYAFLSLYGLRGGGCQMYGTCLLEKNVTFFDALPPKLKMRILIIA